MKQTATARKEEAAERHEEQLEELARLRQRAIALNVPERHAVAIWSTSMVGCLIHLCEYGPDEDKSQLQRHYWQVWNQYQETWDNESKALASPVHRSSGPSAVYDEDSDGYKEWCKRVRDKALHLRAHLLEFQMSKGGDINIFALRQHIINRDGESCKWAHYKHLFPQLRSYLDAVERFFEGES